MPPYDRPGSAEAPAQRGALTEPPEPFPSHCYCGLPVQGYAGDHRCRQCAQHCEIAAYKRRAAFGC
jgi:hypothetical protein